MPEDQAPSVSGKRFHPPKLSGRNSYSLFVACMKLLLPAMAAGLVILVIIWPQINAIDAPITVPIKFELEEQARSLSMMNARFEGLDEKNQPYSLTADEVIQVPGEEEIFDFEFPKGDVMQNDGMWIAVNAKTGRYDRKAETLILVGDVTLFQDQGYELHTETADVDLKGRSAQGSEPVEGQGPGGFVTSEGFRIVDQGQRIFFTGRSSLIAFTDAQEDLQ